MTGAESGLEWLKKTIPVQVGMGLGGNNFFKDFGGKREVGGGPRVVMIAGVGARFLQGWSNSNTFEQ